MLRSRKMATASFLFAGRAWLWTLPLWDEQLTSLGCAPGFLQIVVSGCMAGGCLFCLLSKSWSSTFWGLPEPNLLFFKTSCFKPYSLEKLKKFDPVCFLSKLLWKFVFPHVLLCLLVHLSLFSVTMAPSPLQQTWPFSLLYHAFTPPTTFSMASTLPFIVESVMPLFRSISRIFRMTW